MSKFKVGDYISRISYMKVVEDDGNQLIVQNDKGYKFGVPYVILENELVSSAGQFNSTKKVGITEFLTIFVEQTGNKVFTACFEKQDGSERVLIGRRLGFNGYAGTSEVVDLEIPLDVSKKYDNRVRNIIHRSMKWFILDNTKYILK